MKLTLRTFLAWHDGILPTDEQQALGEKVTASPAAQELRDRIHAVLERQLLPAPRPDARGLGDAATSVAEFLDNTLGTERLKAFEKICLDSDMHLAEVAECHHLLALLSREPQLLAGWETLPLESVLTAIRARTAEHAATADRDAAVADVQELRRALEQIEQVEVEGITASTAGSPCGVEATAGPVATGPRGTAFRSWLTVAAAVAVLITLAGMLLLTVGQTGPREIAAVRQVPQEVGAVSPEEAPEVVGLEEPQPEEARMKEPEADRQGAVPGGPSREPPLPSAGAQEPAAAMTEVPLPPGGLVVPEAAAPGSPPPQEAAAVAMPPLPSVPDGGALAIAAPLVRPANAPLPSAAVGGQGDGPMAVDDPAGAMPLGFFEADAVIGEGALLHMAAVDSGRDWRVLASDARLSEQEEVLVPAGLQPILMLRGVSVRLLPGTQARLSLAPGGMPRVEVIFGRAVVRSSQEDARISVVAGGLQGSLVDGLASPIGIEVAYVRSPGGSAEAGDHSACWARIVSGADGATWLPAPAPADLGEKPDGSEPRQLHAGEEIVWRSGGSLAARPMPIGDTPEWISQSGTRDRLARWAAEALVAKLTADVPLVRGLQELAEDSRVENRMLAVETLALIGRYDELVNLLKEDVAPDLTNRLWLELEAATVPLALARGEQAATRLERAFLDLSPHGSGPLVVRLAHGFEPGRLSAEDAAILFDSLENEHLLVRRYALKCLKALYGSDPRLADMDWTRYRPEGTEASRRQGAKWLRTRLTKGQELPAGPPGDASADGDSVRGPEEGVPPAR